MSQLGMSSDEEVTFSRGVSDHARRYLGRAVRCQVPGCKQSLSEKAYYRRYRICNYHSTLPKIVLQGREKRWCQQCGRFQDLGEFDGDRKTCRAKLTRHNSRRKTARGLSRACSTEQMASSSLSPSASAAAPPGQRDAATRLGWQCSIKQEEGCYEQCNAVASVLSLLRKRQQEGTQHQQPQQLPARAARRHSVSGGPPGVHPAEEGLQLASATLPSPPRSPCDHLPFEEEPRLAPQSSMTVAGQLPADAVLTPGCVVKSIDLRHYAGEQGADRGLHVASARAPANPALHQLAPHAASAAAEWQGDRQPSSTLMDLLQALSGEQEPALAPSPWMAWGASLRLSGALEAPAPPAPGQQPPHAGACSVAASPAARRSAAPAPTTHGAASLLSTSSQDSWQWLASWPAAQVAYIDV